MKLSLGMRRVLENNPYGACSIGGYGRTHMNAASKANPWFLLGVFLTCMCVLMLQIIDTRILSVISWYHLAFFSISMAMFGMTAGSLVIYFKAEWFPAERLLENLIWICSAFAIAIVLSTLLLISTVLIIGGKPEFLMMVLLWLKLIVILATPYFFAGMAISLALTRSPWPVPLVYGVDLLGAATGCLVVLAVLTFVDSVSALFLVGMLGALASISFSIARRGLPSFGEPLLPVARLRIFARPAILAMAFALLAFGNGAIQPYGLRLSIAKNQVESVAPGVLGTRVSEYLRWNSFSRVNITPSYLGSPAMWGPSSETPHSLIEQRDMEIDASAATAIYRFDGDFRTLDFLKYDVTNLAYYIRHAGRAAVIGVGGGRDILSAHLFGFRDITGVELNPIFINLFSRVLRSYNHLADLKGTRLVVDEGRSWFARSADHFDSIQMSLVDSWAATGAGAFSLSENGLYTTEGWRTFFDHLTPTGTFTVSRWYSPSNVNETGRMLSLAMTTLMDERVSNPRDHIFLAAVNNLATLIVARAPFTPAELTTLTTTANRLHFTILVSPQSTSKAPVLSQIMAATTPQELNDAVERYPLDLSAPTDDRPFFFNQLRILDPASFGLALTSAGVGRGNLLATITLAIVVTLSTILVLITTILPSLPSIRRVTSRVAAFGSVYFVLIGLGFMFVEIGLIQRISVYLGHPVYGMAIGLFGIVASTGLGSLSSYRLSLLIGLRLQLWAVTLGLYIILLPYWFPLLINHFAAGSLGVRAVVSLIAIVPSGVLMGFGFPTGMQIVNAIDSRPTPWFWSVNGAAGVLASGIAVLVSIQAAINVTLWCGAACYLLLGPTAIYLARLRHSLSGVVAVPAGS
jgi:hypothetical protein